MKKIISFLFAIILLVSITPAVFAAGQPFITADVSYTISESYDKTASSYLNVFLRNITEWNSYGVSDGEYPGWCFDYDLSISAGAHYEAGIYNPYDTANAWYESIANAPNRWNVIPWDKITYLINVFRDGGIDSSVPFLEDYTQAYLDTYGPAWWNHIQYVIWHYTNSENAGLQELIKGSARDLAIIDWLDKVDLTNYDPTKDDIQLLVTLGAYKSTVRKVQLTVIEVPKHELTYNDKQTAWAIGNNKNNDLLGMSSNWGWNNGPLEEGSYSYDIWAGAGGNDTNKGTLVGSVHIVYADGKVTVSYELLNGIKLSSPPHLWVGSTQLPIKNGKYTSAPGQMNSPLDTEIDVSQLGEVYVAFHVDVNIPDGWWN